MNQSVSGPHRILWIVLWGIMLHAEGGRLMADGVIKAQLAVDVGAATEPFRLKLGVNPAWPGEKFGSLPPETWKPMLDAGVTMLRTHDLRPMAWNALFPNWAADPQAESSYHFVESDRIMKGMVDAGFMPLLRIGPNWQHGAAGLMENPPDAKKWAQIAERIVAHYVDGWAGGFHYSIPYVEIWNEPEYETFWTGGVPKFYDLCTESLRLIKKMHPALKVGADAAASARRSDYTDKLLAHLADPGDGGGRVPLDFYSWHDYAMNPGSTSMIDSVIEAKKYLDANGYGSAENLCTEWNPTTNDDAGYYAQPNASAVVSCVLLGSEIAGLDGIFFYPGVGTGDGYESLFELTDTGLVANTMGKSQIAFHQLQRLTPLKLAVVGSAKSPGPIAVAGKTEDGSLVQVMIADEGSRNNVIVLSVSGLQSDSVQIQWFAQDGNHDLGTPAESKTVKVNNGKVVLTHSYAAPATMLVQIKR